MFHTNDEICNANRLSVLYTFANNTNDVDEDWGNIKYIASMKYNNVGTIIKQFQKLKNASCQKLSMSNTFGDNATYSNVKTEYDAEKMVFVI